MEKEKFDDLDMVCIEYVGMHIKAMPTYGTHVVVRNSNLQHSHVIVSHSNRSRFK
jgi:hypothetical protein